MGNQNVLIIAGSLILATVLTYFVLNWAKSNNDANSLKQAEKADHVLIVNTNLPVGTKLKSDHLEWQPWPSELLSTKYIVKSTRKAEDLHGAMLITALTRGQPILDEYVVHPEHAGLLAHLVKPGQRAVAISLDPSENVAGLVSPGDIVDVILTHRPAQNDKNIVSETILTDLTVLAIDKQISPKNDEDDKKPNKTIAKTATLQVSAKQAEILAVGNALGNLSLSLKSAISDSTDHTNNSLTQSSEVSRAYNFPIKEDVDTSITVIKGGQTAEIEVKPI